jgi:hypothetical protein
MRPNFEVLEATFQSLQRQILKVETLPPFDRTLGPARALSPTSWEDWHLSALNGTPFCLSVDETL